MKPTPSVLGVASVVLYLAWLGWQYLKGLGRAFGNADPSTGPGDVYWVFVVVGIATLGCTIASFFVPAGAARGVAAAPLALILLGQGFISYQEISRNARHARERAARVAVRLQKLSGISRDFVQMPDPRDPPSASQASFLTHDRELGTIVLIDVSYDAVVTASAFGRINGGVLETTDPVETEARLKSYFQRYVDAQGKSVFDRYTVEHRPGQDYRDYRLERYDTRE